MLLEVTDEAWTTAMAPVQRTPDTTDLAEVTQYRRRSYRPREEEAGVGQVSRSVADTQQAEDRRSGAVGGDRAGTM